jgi:hypothetical protein
MKRSLLRWLSGDLIYKEGFLPTCAVAVAGIGCAFLGLAIRSEILFWIGVALGGIFMLLILPFAVVLASMVVCFSVVSVFWSVADWLRDVRSGRGRRGVVRLNVRLQ